MVISNFEGYLILKRLGYVFHLKMGNAQRLLINVNMHMVKLKLKNWLMIIFLIEAKEREIVEIIESIEIEIEGIIEIIEIEIIGTIEIIEIIGIVEIIEIIEIIGNIEIIEITNNIDMIDTKEKKIMEITKDMIDMKETIAKTTDIVKIKAQEIIKIKMDLHLCQCLIIHIWAIIVFLMLLRFSLYASTKWWLSS